MCQLSIRLTDDRGDGIKALRFLHPQPINLITEISESETVLGIDKLLLTYKQDWL